METEYYYNVDDFIKMYDEEIDDYEMSEDESFIDRAILLLIEMFKDKFIYSFPKDDPYWFHKQFHQVDVIKLGDGKMDNIFYTLLAGEATVFYKTMDKLYKGKY